MQLTFIYMSKYVRPFTYLNDNFLLQRDIYNKVAEELSAKKKDPCWIYPMAKEEATTVLRARVKVCENCESQNLGTIYRYTSSLYGVLLMYCLSICRST